MILRARRSQKNDVEVAIKKYIVERENKDTHRKSDYFEDDEPAAIMIIAPFVGSTLWITLFYMILLQN